MMKWNNQWRENIWARIGQTWDVVIIGGGITGAGILREATRRGLRALLVEQRDFGWGTSSRSSKLVHGGLRYLKEGKIILTQASVRERNRLLDEGKGLVTHLGFLLATYKGQYPGKWTYGVGLSIYDLLALQWNHTYHSAVDFQMLAPRITRERLEGGFSFADAQTDDARLVLRVIREAVAAGGYAMNYIRAEELIRDGDDVKGIRLLDVVNNRRADVYAKCFINATGVWSDNLRKQVDAQPHIRPLRGSHLIFPAWCVPVAQAVTFPHPGDHRPILIIPWEGITLVGTTDIDHDRPLQEEPSITPEETAYLMSAVESEFPSLHVTLDDIISTFAGIRPVIDTKKVEPSKASREHVVWEEKGLLTVTGGKLTTFRLIALDALEAARHRLPAMTPVKRNGRMLDNVNVTIPPNITLDESQKIRLLGRYGNDASAVISLAREGELELIPGTPYIWAELRYAARSEGVVHLDDLLLRRVRLGLLLPNGGESLLPKIREITVAELEWNDARWEVEETAYKTLWQQCYSLPDRKTIPEWRKKAAELKVNNSRSTH